MSFFEKQKMRMIRSVVSGFVTPENIDLLLEKVDQMIKEVELLPGEVLVTAEWISFQGQHNIVVQTKSQDMQPMRIIKKLSVKKMLLEADQFLDKALTEKQDGN